MNSCLGSSLLSPQWAIWTYAGKHKALQVEIYYFPFQQWPGKSLCTSDTVNEGFEPLADLKKDSFHTVRVNASSLAD